MRPVENHDKTHSHRSKCAEYEKAKAVGKEPDGQARAAGLPLLVSRMPATMLWGTGSKRNGSIE